MPERFEDRKALAAKIEWEGGLLESLDYGITADMMPEGDGALTEAWAALETVYRGAIEPLAEAVEKLLPEAGDGGE